MAPNDVRKGEFFADHTARSMNPFFLTRSVYGE